MSTISSEPDSTALPSTPWPCWSASRSAGPVARCLKQLVKPISAIFSSRAGGAVDWPCRDLAVSWRQRAQYGSGEC